MCYTYVNIFYLFNNNLKYEITKQPLRASKYYKKNHMANTLTPFQTNLRVFLIKVKLVILLYKNIKKINKPRSESSMFCNC
jgi:hypothetical protein